MAYRDEGTGGPPLLFLHGTGCDTSDWDGVISNLGSEGRTLRLDFRGHGDSDVPHEPFTVKDLATDVGQLMESLDLPPVVICGHSLGGMVAMEIARRPSKVAGLVLLEGWTSLAAASAFREPRFYGSLGPAAVATIQDKAQMTRARFEPSIWHGFWKSVEELDASVFLRSTRIPVTEVYGSIGRWEGTVPGLRVPANP